ncbi:hypothetical protein BpHYR1_020998 [Brachionus plicatilis]|uniref:Uncharacterized protein n=1 Tax=Brachionus plicatilis TaxID=10195 RepID=A0A3M7RLG2_BRAPC|nr:hypothetical protein BpHYR1_020998 [Brachionus plicatilis]
MHKLMIPEFKLRIFDQLNKSDQESPRMRSVHNQPFQQHPGNLFLNGFGVCLGEQIEQNASKVMSVTVWIAELIGNGIDEQVAALAVQVGDQRLKYINESAVDGVSKIGMSGSEALGAERLNAIRAHVHDQRVHQLNVVLGAEFGRRLQIGAQLAQKRNGRPTLNVRVQVALELVGHVVHVRKGYLWRARVNVGDHIGRERIGQLHASRKCAQHQISQLDAVGGHHVAELVVRIAQKLRKVVQQHKKETKRALLAEQAGVHVPRFDGLVGRGLAHLKHLGHEEAVGDELEPGVGKAGRLARSDYVVHIDERLQHRVNDGLQVVLGQRGLEQQHEEQPLKGHRLELARLGLLVEEQAAGHQTQHLVEQIYLVDVLDKGIQPLVAGGPLTLADEHVARFHAALGADAKKSGDHVVGFEEALRVHLQHKLLKGLGVFFERQHRVVLYPLGGGVEASVAAHVIRYFVVHANHFDGVLELGVLLGEPRHRRYARHRLEQVGELDVVVHARVLYVEKAQKLVGNRQRLAIAALHKLGQVQVHRLLAEQLVLEQNGDALHRVLYVLVALEPDFLHLLEDPVAGTEALVVEYYFEQVDVAVAVLGEQDVVGVFDQGVAFEQVGDELFEQVGGAVRLLGHFEVVDGEHQVLEVERQKVAVGHARYFVADGEHAVVVVHVHVVVLVEVGLGDPFLGVYFEAGQIFAELFVHAELVRADRAHFEPDLLGHLFVLVVERGRVVVGARLRLRHQSGVKFHLELSLQLNDRPLYGYLLQVAHAKLDVILNNDAARVVYHVLVNIGQVGRQRLAKLNFESVE